MVKWFSHWCGQTYDPPQRADFNSVRELTAEALKLCNISVSNAIWFSAIRQGLGVKFKFDKLAKLWDIFN